MAQGVTTDQEEGWRPVSGSVQHEEVGTLFWKPPSSPERQLCGRVSQEKRLFLYEQVRVFKFIQVHLRALRSPSLLVG